MLPSSVKIFKHPRDVELKPTVRRGLGRIKNAKQALKEKVKRTLHNKQISGSECGKHAAEKPTQPPQPPTPDEKQLSSTDATSDSETTLVKEQSVDPLKIQKNHEALLKLAQKAKGLPKALLNFLNCFKAPSTPDCGTPLPASSEEADDSEDNLECEDVSEEFEKQLELLAVELRYAEQETSNAHSTAKYLSSRSGNNNDVHIVEYDDGLKVCIRVPFCGRPDLWSPNDARSFRSQALTMRYISENIPTFPIPKIIAYDSTLDNLIGRPYVVMSFAEGQTLRSLWYEDYPGMTEQEREQRRSNSLKDLAFALAELRKLPFDQMGSIEFPDSNLENPQTGPFFGQHFGMMRNGEFDASDENYLSDPHSLVLADRLIPSMVLWQALNYSKNREMTQSLEGAKEMDILDEGNSKVYQMLFEQLPSFYHEFEAGTPEPFFIRNVDLDMQNILVDDDGHITAIIDWDRCETAPAYMSWASLPHWLSEDWDVDYQWPADANAKYPQMAPSEIEEYRAIYASYLQEASDNHPASLIASKTAMMSAIWMYVGTDDHTKLLKNFLETLISRADHDTLLYCLGHKTGYVKEMEFLRSEIKKLFAPDEPYEAETDMNYDLAPAVGMLKEYYIN
ncbi:MAG: hypothetical protein M1820_006622 [Bogoriella megaspora]|nr:MAG: hypothetical protein M1820_006622 [Bogoriella megaspora]